MCKRSGALQVLALRNCVLYNLVPRTTTKKNGLPRPHKEGSPSMRDARLNHLFKVTSPFPHHFQDQEIKKEMMNAQEGRVRPVDDLVRQCTCCMYVRI